MSISVNKSLHVLMVSTSYPKDKVDWRGLFIRNIANALAETPNIKLSLWSPPGDISDSIEYQCTDKEAEWLENLSDKGGIAHVVRKGGWTGLIAPLKLLYFIRCIYKRNNNIDLYHVNWLQNAIPLLGTKRPALVSVLGSDFGFLKIPGMTLLLRKVFKSRRCILAPNAGWMVGELEKRFGDVAKIISIPFGIDKSWYQLRREWQPEEIRKWLIVCRVTEKKLGPIFEWGKDIFNSKDELHLFGPMQENIKIPDWVHYHGPTHAEDLLGNWFPKATGLITLSTHDEGRPQVMLEAMAAGLPIIASALPAHNEIITHKETGWVVDSEESFADGVHWMCDAENNNLVSTNAKNSVLNNIGTWNDCAQRYMTAYNWLCEK